MQRFRIAQAPILLFGSERITELGAVLADRRLLRAVVIVSRSVVADPDVRSGILALLEDAGIEAHYERYDRLPGPENPLEAERGPYREASPVVVDAIARAYASSGIQCVVAIGGGSAIDTGKAVSVALAELADADSRDEGLGSIADLLEGVGSRAPRGLKLPFVAVPTTAGTGSEATKNAVLAQPGPSGFKKSLRHERFVPDVALVDPTLQLSCPRELTAASGLDAITQLLESFVSRDATPYTDALALDGLNAAGRSFLRAVERGESDLDARAGMAYAAYLSGVCLANAGLGTVHGLAGAAGALTDVPHGVFCGTLIPHVVRRTVDALSKERDSVGTLGKYAAAGRALSGRAGGSLEDQIEMLIDRLTEFVRIGSLAPLRSFGIDDAAAERIAADGGNKANPYQFSGDELADLIKAAK